MAHRQQRSWVRMTGLVLVAMLALASGRELVPGLCATKAALESRNAASGCCQTPHSRDADDSPAVQADIHVFCAFCNLATTLVTASNYAEAPVQLYAAFEPVVAPATFVIERAIDTTHAGRAPPVTFAA